MKKGVDISIENGRKVVRGVSYYEASKVSDLKELVTKSVKKYAGATGFKFKNKDGAIAGKTYSEFGHDIDCLGTALLSLGLKDAFISIISENRYEWGVCFFSIVNGTGVAVPLDKYLPKNEVENLIERGRVEAIFYSPAFYNIMEDIAKSHPGIRYFICIEDYAGAGNNDDRFLTVPGLIKRGKSLMDAGDCSFTNAPIDRYKMSILLFTSGTTNISKGVMLSHANIASNVAAISAAIRVIPEDVHLSLLPLHHTFENTVGLMFMVHSGVCIAYCEGIKHIAQNLLEYGVTVLVTVPAILEAMYKKMQDGIEKAGKTKLFKVFGVISDILRLVNIDIRRKLFKSVFKKIGPGLRLAVSGAAPLDPRVVIGFDKIGLKLLQGYGLTETSPVVAANNDYVNKPGTIGYPLAGIEISIDSPDENGIGEIITRGENVMLGYYEDPKATVEAIDADGWFRTGDLGMIDKDGFTKITGRVKSMIVLTNGKKAFPEEYEVLLNNIPGVKDSFVWGNRAPDGDIQVCAKLLVNEEWFIAEKGGVPAESELAAAFGAAIKEINRSVPQYKIIRYFVMTRENLVQTITLKTKRNVEFDKTKGMLDKAGIDMRKASGRYIEGLVH